MSDTIIINTNPPTSETLVINTSTKAPESINVNQLGYVLSVNGKIGVVILDKNDIGLGNVDNTSDLNKPISSETLSALFLKTDLGLFLSLNSFITSNSGNWDSVYFTVNELSGNWNSVYSYVNQTSANEFNQEAVTTFILANSSNITQVNSLVNSNSSNWNIAYNSSTIYQSNSSTYATINFSNNKFLPLSGGNISGTLNVQTKLLSAGTDLFDIFLTSETDSKTLNYVASSYNLFISNGNTVNLSSINTTFATNSAKYESVYSNVIGNSANWNTAFNRSTVFSTVSGRYNNSSTIVESNSANWNYAYNVTTVYSSASSTFATNSTVNSVSSLLTPLTLTNNLTSQLVLNTTFNNYKTNVASITATLLPTSIYQNASGNWHSTFTNVQNNSANWNTAFNRSTVFTNVSSRYNSSSTVVESNSANWNNAYNTGTVYQANSGTYATYNFVNSNFLNLTGGTIEGNLNINGNFYIAGSAANINVRDLVITDPLIFLAEGNPSDILDIGFTASYKSNGDPYKHTGLVRSHINKKWTLFSGLSTEVLSALSINFNDPSLQIDTLRANLEGNVVGGTVQGNTLSSTGLVYAQGGNSNNWNTAFDRSTVFSSVSGRYNSSSTVVESNSANWNFGFNAGTFVQANSANWEESSEILPTVTNYLSTNNVLISGLNVTNNLIVDTNTLFVDAANNRVGIGTTTPSEKLSVIGNITLNNNNLINGFIQNTLPETYSSNNGTTLTGTVYFADASAVTAGVVTGIGTAFLSELKVGDRVQNTSNTYFGGQVGNFYVKSIQSNTQFTLSRSGGSQSTGSGSAFSAKRYRALFSVADQSGNWSFGITNDGAFVGGGASIGVLSPNSFNWGGIGVFTTGSPNTGGVRGYSWTSTGGWESFYTDHGSPNLYVGVPAGVNGSTAGLLTVGSGTTLGSLGVYAKNASTVVASFKGATSQSQNYLNISSSSGTGDILTVLSSGNVGIGTTAPNEKLTVSGNISATQTVFASDVNISGDSTFVGTISTSSHGTSDDWNTAFNISTQYQNVSSSFATNTTVNSVSSLLTPLTLTNTLTSHLLPTTTYQQASGNWEATYTTFSQNSGNYCTKSLALAFAIAL